MIEVLKEIVVPLAWPLIALFCILVFRKDIKSVFKRLVKAGPSGLVMTPQISDQTTDTADSISPNKLGELDIQDDGLKPFIDEIEEYLKQNPKNKNVESLIKITAIFHRRAYSADIYRTIFGTQLEAIQRMISESQSLDDLQDLYQKHAQQAQEHKLPNIEAWVQFLITTKLVKISEGMLTLTPYGKSYYDLMILSGVSMKSRAW